MTYLLGWRHGQVGRQLQRGEGHAGGRGRVAGDHLRGDGGRTQAEDALASGPGLRAPARLIPAVVEAAAAALPVAGGRGWVAPLAAALSVAGDHEGVAGPAELLPFKSRPRPGRLSL